MVSVLVVSPPVSVPGGVSVFIACMKRHVTRSVIDSFYVGSDGRGSESLWTTARRLLAAPLRLARQVGRTAPDVVHLNPSFDLKSLIRDGLLLLALRLVGYRRVLIYFHGWDIGLQRRVLGSVFLRRSMARIFNKAALIAVLSADFRDALTATGVDAARIVVTRTMWDDAGFDAVKDQPAPSARRFILFLSRFDRAKGARELLQAFVALAQDYPDMDLVLAGDGPDAAALRTLAMASGLSRRVIFTGYVEGDAKWRLLRDCALFALPSFYGREGMPVAVLEAMGAGKPLLVGPAGALRSIVADPANGVTLDNVTARDVETGLRRLLDDAGFADAAGRRNAEIAARIFAAPVVTAQIEDFYDRVALC